MFTRLFLATPLLVFAPSALSMDACPAPAKAAFERGQSAVAEQDFTAAVAGFSEATGLCDDASLWQALGDAHAARLTASNGAMNDAAQLALEAYGNAFATARREQNDAAGAQAARSIAELGLITDDPLKSQNWLVVAAKLEPDHPDLPALEARLDDARAQLSASEIDTGLSQTRGIGMVNNLLGGDVTAQAFWDAPEGAGGGAAGVDASDSDDAEPAPRQSSINIPIRFDSNSTSMTADTAANVENLARVLAARPAETSVILTGHADVRGDAAYNLKLSLARAEAVKEQLVSLEPSLAGRIEALGDGESRPMDGAMTDRAHSNNRRLEVTIREPGGSS